MKRKIFIGCVSAACAVAFACIGYADDLAPYFNIFSPGSAQQMNYARQQPPFKIAAPSGWYMALVKEESSSADRAFLCKKDPREWLSKGNLEPFPFPYLKVAFLPNPEKAPASLIIQNQIDQLQAVGAPILVNEMITVDSVVGRHFTTRVPNVDFVMDTYLFSKDDVFISIKALCEAGLFEEVKKEIKQAIDSIKFSL